MADTPSKPRRRWLSFSLRTLFVVVTALAAAISIANWISSNAKLVAERREILGRMKSEGTGVDVVDSESTFFLIAGREIGPVAPLPWVRKMLGDKRVAVIRLGKVRPKFDDLCRARKAFPEATVCEFSDWRERYDECFFNEVVDLPADPLLRIVRRRFGPPKP